MKNTTSILIVSFLLLASCSGSEDLLYRNLDQALLSDFKNLKNDFLENKISAQNYFNNLRKLQNREHNLFEKARLYKFNDLVEYNYWHRGRLKFPSNIEMELNRIMQTLRDTTAIN